MLPKLITGVFVSLVIFDALYFVFSLMNNFSLPTLIYIYIYFCNITKVIQNLNLFMLSTRLV